MQADTIPKQSARSPTLECFYLQHLAAASIALRRLRHGVTRALDLH